MPVISETLPLKSPGAFPSLPSAFLHHFLLAVLCSQAFTNSWKGHEGLGVCGFGWFCAPGQPGGFGFLLVGKIKNFGNGVDVVAGDKEQHQKKPVRKFSEAAAAAASSFFYLSFIPFSLQKNPSSGFRMLIFRV